MTPIAVLFLLLAFVCFIADAFNLWHDNPRRPALTPLGLAFWAMAVLLGYFYH